MRWPRYTGTLNMRKLKYKVWVHRFFRGRLYCVLNNFNLSPRTWKWGNYRRRPRNIYGSKRRGRGKTTIFFHSWEGLHDLAKIVGLPWPPVEQHILWLFEPSSCHACHVSLTWISYNLNEFNINLYAHTFRIIQRSISVINRKNKINTSGSRRVACRASAVAAAAAICHRRVKWT